MLLSRMVEPGRRGAGPRNAFVVAILIAAAVIAYTLLSDEDAAADYDAAVARFGRSRIDHLVMATMPPALAGTCNEQHGRNQALIDAVVAYNARTEPAQRALLAEIEALGTMTEGERRAIEQTVLAAAIAALPKQAACNAALERIASGAYDLTAAETGREPRPETLSAQNEGN